MKHLPIRIPLFCVLVFVCSSCSTLTLKLKFGGCSPNRKWSDTRLHRYLDKNNYEYDQLWRFKEDSLYAMAKRSHKPGWKPDFRIMTIHCFDPSGSLLMNWTVCEGFIDELGLLDTFPPRYNGPFFPTDLENELRLYLNGGSQPEITDIPEADLTMIVYWARFMGKANRKSIDEVVAYRKRCPDKRINLILVSVDRDLNWIR